MLTTVGIRELKQQTSELVRQVRFMWLLPNILTCPCIPWMKTRLSGPQTG